MSKAILIMENMPNRCADCILRASPDPKNPFCVTNFKNISDDEYYNKRPGWCPLRELPQKIGIDKALEMPRIGCISDVINSYNACLDEIERKKENE